MPDHTPEPDARPANPALPLRRLFFALELPELIRSELGELRDPRMKAAWITAEKLHLTLRFFGEVDTGTADRIIDRAEAVRGRSFLLQLGGTGVFPGPRRPQALWAGLALSHPHLFALQQQLEDLAVGLGFPLAGPRFSPHVTVARYKGSPEPVRQWLKAHAGFESAPFEVTQFVLYRSRLLKDGAVYQELRRFPLER